MLAAMHRYIYKRLDGCLHQLTAQQNPAFFGYDFATVLSLFVCVNTQWRNSAVDALKQMFLREFNKLINKLYALCTYSVL